MRAIVGARHARDQRYSLCKTGRIARYQPAIVAAMGRSYIFNSS
jgi:hypothetical protein